MKRNKKFNKLAIFWVFVSFVLIVGIIFTLEVATSGAELTKLEAEETRLAQENRNLSDSLIKSSSVISYEEKLGELGFIKPEKIVYIAEEGSVAKLP